MHDRDSTVLTFNKAFNKADSDRAIDNILLGDDSHVDSNHWSTHLTVYMLNN